MTPNWGGNSGSSWWRGFDLNERPFGYEPNELPGCSTPRHGIYFTPRRVYCQGLLRFTRVRAVRHVVSIRVAGCAIYD